MPSTTQLSQEESLLLGRTANYGSNASAYGVFPISANQEANPYQGAVANPQEGGQFGFGPRIMQLDAGSPLILNPCIIVITQLPRMFDRNPEWQKTFKSSFELDAKSITGIDFEYNVQEATSLVGHDGQNLSMPTMTQRSPVNPTASWTEKYGNIVFGLHYLWILGIQHPDTQCSFMSAMAELEDGGNINNVPPWLITTFSMSFMAIQPDPTGLYNRAVDAAFYTAVWPTGTGMIGFKKEINSVEQPERQINYKGLVQHNDNTREVGSYLMKMLNFYKVNMQRATTTAGVDAKIDYSGLKRAQNDMNQAYSSMIGANYELTNIITPPVSREKSYV